MAKQKINQAAYDSIIRGGTSTEKQKRPSPLGVPLTVEEQAKLTRIADELGVKRHHVLQYAVRLFLARWDQGERPKITQQTTNKLEV